MMKYLLSLCICMSVLLLSSNSMLFDFTGTDPDLPNIPFDYEIDSFPSHLDTTEWGTNDPTVFDFITNDGATLGRVLFYDEKLSASNDMACGTCHLQEFSFADDLVLSEGVTQNTRRNSLQLNDLGWTNNTGFFWDVSQQDLHSTIVLPLTDPNEIGLTDINALIAKLNATSYYPDLFYNAFGSSAISEQLIVEALAQFISSITSFNTKFDQSHDPNSGVSLTQSELNGKILFEEQCSVCHTDGSSFLFEIGIAGFTYPYNNGLTQDSSDLGAGEWDPVLNFLFKPPTLRNIALTGPYMHDGRFATLVDVIDHYSDEAVETSWSSIPTGGFGFSQQEKDDLLAFMHTYTDNTMLTEEKWSDPFPLVSKEELVEPLSLELSVFPNPAADVLNLSFENAKNKMAFIKIFNVDGKLVKKASGHNQQISVNIGHLIEGNYIVNLEIGSTRKSTPFTIVR